MNLTNTGDWAQFGLAGLVIFALFLILFNLINSSMKRYDNVMAEHRSERKEWRDSEDKRSERAEQAMRDLASSIRDSNK